MTQKQQTLKEMMLERETICDDLNSVGVSFTTCKRYDELLLSINEHTAEEILLTHIEILKDRQELKKGKRPC